MTTWLIIAGIMVAGGLIGMFRREPLEDPVDALMRGLMGAAVLIGVMWILRG